MPFNFEIHTHFHHFLPATNTMTEATTAPSTSTSTELEVLVALVGRLSAASMEAMRLALEVQGMSVNHPPGSVSPFLSPARLPAVVAGERAAATAAANAAAVAAAAAELPADPVWVRGVPKTPAEIVVQYPEGSGETWYVVIRGREPGFYRTSYVHVLHLYINSQFLIPRFHSAEADRVCNGVPNQLKEKKKSRRDAIAWYRSLYEGPDGEGVQKWMEA
jgi:hypothetical protein